MKNVLYLLLCAFLFAGCSNTNEDIQGTKTEVQPSQVVSLEVVGNHQVKVDNKTIIPISELTKKLKEKDLKRQALASVIVHEDDSHSDLIDIQDALRKANILRINYSTARS